MFYLNATVRTSMVGSKLEDIFENHIDWAVQEVLSVLVEKNSHSQVDRHAAVTFTTTIHVFHFIRR
jgi:hypothetical protein